MLFNTKTDELELKRVRIFDEEKQKVIPIFDFKKNIDIKSGEGIAGKVVQSGKMYIVNDPLHDENFKNYQNSRVKINQLICIPLKTNNITFGVINIANKKDNSSFNDNDISLLEMLANQAAVCMENAKLFKLSITDGLTNLFVIRHFKVRFEDELSRARRYNEELSLLLFDIDHFKTFNDTYGHQAGDLVLIEVAKTIKKIVREVDIPARYGGEEFCVLLPQTDLEGAFLASERLRKAIENTQIISENNEILKVTVSIGISNHPDNSKDMNELIRCADTALYFAKENGRNNSQIYKKEMGNKSEK
jgi:diguanylate cyclase (GGDEF)-like protein